MYYAYELCTILLQTGLSNNFELTALKFCFSASLGMLTVLSYKIQAVCCPTG